MKTLLLLVFAAVALCVHGHPASPAPPVISETFSTRYRTVCTKSGEFYYNEIGEIHSDIAAKKYLEKVASDQVHMPPKYMWLLQLYNVNQTYIIQWLGLDPYKPNAPCNNESSNGVMSPVWAWTRNATYNNTIKEDNRLIDVFTTTNDQGTEFAIGVAQDKPNIPYFKSQRISVFNVVFYYYNFDPTPPPASVFTVFSECN